MASAKTAKAKPVALAKSSAELWARAFMEPEHVPEFLKRVDQAESLFNDPKQTHNLSEVDWVNQWQIIVTDMSLSHIDMLYLREAFCPPADLTHEPRFNTPAQLLEECAEVRQRLTEDYDRKEYEQWGWRFHASRVLSLWQDMTDLAPRVSHPPMPDRDSLHNQQAAARAVNEVVAWCRERMPDSEQTDDEAADDPPLDHIREHSQDQLPLTDSQQRVLNYIASLNEGERQATSKILDYFGNSNHLLGESTVKSALSFLVKIGRLDSKRDVKPPGYGLPGWK